MSAYEKCERCGRARPVCMFCAGMDEVRADLTSRIRWWHRDITYKAPEQVGMRYAVCILDDLLAILAAKDNA